MLVCNAQCVAPELVAAPDRGRPVGIGLLVLFRIAVVVDRKIGKAAGIGVVVGGADSRIGLDQGAGFMGG